MQTKLEEIIWRKKSQSWSIGWTGRKETEMTIEEQIKKVLVEYRAIGEDWKIKVTSIERKNEGSDSYFAYVDCIRPRCRKPATGWRLSIDTVKGLCYFDQSEHWNY